MEEASYALNNVLQLQIPERESVYENKELVLILMYNDRLTP